MPPAPLRAPQPGAGPPPPAEAAGRRVAGIRTRLVVIHWATALFAAGGGWVGLPYLFDLHGHTVRQLQTAFLLSVGSVIVLAGVVAWVASLGIGALARSLEAGETPDAAGVARAAKETLWHPRIMALWAVTTGSASVSFTAWYGYRACGLDANTALMAGVYGILISTWLALAQSNGERFYLVPVTRVLFDLGVTEWPGPRTTLTTKVAFLVVAATLLPSVFVGVLAFQFAQTALAHEVGRNTETVIPLALAPLAALDANRARPDARDAALAHATAAVRRHTRLGLVHEGKLVATGGPEVHAVLELPAFRARPPGPGMTVFRDTLDLAVWAPLVRPGYLGVAVVKREEIQELLLASRTAVIALIVGAMLLMGAVGTLIALGIRAPLADVVADTSRVARGDLAPASGRVLTDDEVGELAGHLDRMRARLAEIITRVAELTEEVRASAGSTLDQAQEIGRGATAQAEAVSASVAAIEQMDANLRSVAEGVRELARTFREGSESATRLGQEFDDLAQDVEQLALGAAEAAEAVAGISRDAAQVATEVRGLSGAAQRANLAVTDVDGALRRMREHARGAADAAQETITVAHEGAVNVQRTVEGIERIREGAAEAATQVEALTRRIGEVDRVLAVIDDIAEKTNLLALNASIIAAQAGEHGRGFAVVAGEIRDLATRTATSTREIAETITDVQGATAEAVTVIRESEQRVADGVSLAGAAEDSLGRILLSATRASQAAVEIARDTEAQSETVGEVTREIDQVAAMASRIAGLAGDQATAGDGAREAVARIARLNGQMSEVVAGIAARNRRLLDAFAATADHLGTVERAVGELEGGAGAILAETSRVQAVAEESQARAARMELAARSLDAAADALREEVRFFQVAPAGGDRV